MDIDTLDTGEVTAGVVKIETVKIENDDNKTEDVDSVDAVKPRVCELCGTLLYSFGAYYVHTKSHSNVDTVGTWKCKQCDSSFTRRASLQIHMRRHTGEKPYTCQLCSKTFTQRSSLNSHIKLHKNEETYTCDLCTKNFKTKAYLRNHKKTHNSR